MAEVTYVETVAVAAEGFIDPMSDDGTVHIMVEELDPKWVSSIKEGHLVQPKRLKVSSTSISSSIHRVPNRLRRRHETEFVPRIISIGPFHYHKRKDELKAMEEQKWRYLHNILSRNREDCLEGYLKAIKILEKKARECYSEEFEKLDSDTFVQMMLLDGCFLIEFFRKMSGEHDDDHIFQLGWLLHELAIDLLMLENQIPFFILQHLCDLVNVSLPSLIEGILSFFNNFRFFEKLLPKKDRITHSKHQFQHFLHLLHTSLVLFTEKEYTESRGVSVQMIQCISQLKEAGIRFKKRTDINETGNCLDIKFQKGVIEIPPILVDDNTNSILLNLVAFEQCYCHCKKYITDYIFFMDWLINTAKDVRILCEKGIIENWLGSDEDVATLFNNMGKEVTVGDNNFYLSPVCNEINQYCGAVWPKLRATMIHDYFKNPCAIISFVAAVFLLLFTLTQAFFSSFPKFAYGH